MIKKYVFISLIYIFVSSFLNHCYALTPDQIIKLKKAGVSDRTIQMMLQQEKEAKEANSYDQIGMREIKDKEGNVVTIYSTGRSAKEGAGDSDGEQVYKAWKMLQHMIIDNRK
jgi:hypothetical protein